MLAPGQAERMKCCFSKNKKDGEGNIVSRETNSWQGHRVLNPLLDSLLNSSPLWNIRGTTETGGIPLVPGPRSLPNTRWQHQPASGANAHLPGGNIPSAQEVFIPLEF